MVLNNVLLLVQEKVNTKCYKVKNAKTHATVLFPMVFVLINAIYCIHISKTIINVLDNVNNQTMDMYIMMKICNALHNVLHIIYKIKSLDIDNVNSSAVMTN